jgi:diguanylate cyclase (GGDEF)-like protein
MLFAHGAMFLLRSPLGTLANAPAGDSLAMSGWLELLSLEGLLFTISIAFILLAMAKERTEYHHRTAASTDSLTGVPNRRGFLEQAMAQRAVAGANSPVAVLLFDLDHFKLVNDRYGHAVGDRTLQIFADTARAHVGEAGTVGRWGGDEFVAVLFDTSREIAATIGERIQRDFEDAAADIEGRVVGATVSTGVAFSGHGPFELPALLLRADQALYKAKEDGRNRLAITMPDIRTQAGGEASAGHIVTLRSRNAA